MLDKEIKEILLRRKNLVILDGYEHLFENKENRTSVLPLAYRLGKYGYLLSPELFDKLSNLSTDDIETIKEELIQMVKIQRGAEFNHHLMFPDFPNFIKNEDEAILYMIEFIHYWTGGEFRPQFDETKGKKVLDRGNIVVLEEGTIDDLYHLASNILSSKTSISNQDTNDYKNIFLYDIEKSIENIPEEIPMKENRALICELLFSQNRLSDEFKSKFFKTATDVLRFMATLSSQNASLSTPILFKKFSRAERRMILSILENCKNIEEDMNRYYMQWIRAGEILHPGEFAKKYPVSFAAFQKIRNNEHIETFNSKVEKLLVEKDFINAAKLLATRPGELARKMDYLLRESDSNLEIISIFENVAEKVASPVLLQTAEHFNNRNNENINNRIAFPKGSTLKAVKLSKINKAIPEEICHKVSEICALALISIYKKREPMGKTYIDPALSSYTIPFAQRFASDMAKPLTRCSRITIPEETNFIVPFIHWHNIDNDQDYAQRIDIDLSATFLDEEMNYLSDISYYNLTDKKYNCHHSGDIIDAPEGASEFISLDLNKLAKNNISYIAFNVYSFTKHPFYEIPECFFGWQYRNEECDNNAFDAKTVENKISLASTSTMVIACLVDVKNRQIIWLDYPTNGDFRSANNSYSNKPQIRDICSNMISIKKTNLYELFSLNALARNAELVKKPEDAETIFSINEGITPFDISEIMADYL